MPALYRTIGLTFIPSGISGGGKDPPLRVLDERKLVLRSSREL